MTVVIDGEVVDAPGTDMEALEQRLMGLSAVSVEQREAEITATLEQSAQLLALVSQASDPARFASAGKSAAAMASEYSKRLGVSKDIILDAQVQQRRWERALGVAIREGQEMGVVETPSEARSRATRIRDQINHTNLIKPRPLDYAKAHELQGVRGDGIYAMTDNVDPADFDIALNEARSGGNVSRANVVRKLKAANVVDMATGEVIDPDTLTPENRAERQAERERMLGLYTDAQTFTGALNRLHALHSPRAVAHYLEVHRVSQSRPDFATQHHNPESIRRIAQYLNDYATALEEQS